MNKERIFRFLLLTLPLVLLCLVQTNNLTAQTVSNPTAVKKYKVAIFAPLYLDSVYSEKGTFKYKDAIPKFIQPGLDFVHGAEIALDSMILFEENLDATIYDTKSRTQSVAQLIKSKKLDSLDLIIGSVRDSELKQLADFALLKNIPFISSTFPNDGGINKNPFMVLVTSTLKAHCEAIYSYILQNHGTDKIFLCRKNGSQEDKVASYFKLLNEQDGKPLLNIKTINFDSTVSKEQIQNFLDSNRQTIIIGGSLDETFATNLTKAAYSLNGQFPITLIGMPNWDGFKALMKKDDFSDFPVYFTTPYFNGKWDSYSKMLTNGYNKKFKSKPSDMAFKGFECTYLFTKLLVKYPDDMMSHLNDKRIRNESNVL